MFWYHLLEQIAASICPWLMAAVRAPRHGRVLYMFQENLKLMEKVRTSLKRSCALSIPLDIEELSKIFSKNFWKIWRLLIIQNVNHATGNSGNRRLKIDWNGNSGSLRNFRKFGYTTRDCPFLRKFRKMLFLRHWKFLSIYTGLSRVEDRKEGALIPIYGHSFGRGKSPASSNTIILYPREDQRRNSPAMWFYTGKEKRKGFKQKSYELYMLSQFSQ